MRYPFALSVVAIKERDDDTVYCRHQALFLWADDKKSAQTFGINFIKNECPVEDGWYDHNVAVVCIDKEKLSGG